MEVSYNASFEIAKPFHSLESLLLNLFLKGHLLKYKLKTNILKVAKNVFEISALTAFQMFLSYARVNVGRTQKYLSIPAFKTHPYYRSTLVH